MTVCEIGKINCYGDTYLFMVSTENSMNKNYTFNRCNCLPNCYSTTYGMRTNEKILGRDLIEKKVQFLLKIVLN